MKKRIFSTVLVILVLSSLMVSAYADSAPIDSNKTEAGEAAVEQNRILLLECALEPKEPFAAANMWAEGVRTRNGALQYAVMSPELRNEYYSIFVGLGWVTGVSSPWVDSYEINEKYRRDNSTYRFEVVFTYTDSTKAYFTETEHITVSNINGRWFVSAIERIDIKGKITKLAVDEDNQLESFFVEAVSTESGNYDKANVIITSDTKIFEGYTDKELSADDLKEGTNVSVTFTDDPRIMIYPVSAEAKVIRIIVDEALPESIELRYETVELEGIPSSDDLSGSKKLEERQLGKLNDKDIILSLYTDSSDKVNGVFMYGDCQYRLSDLGYSHDLESIELYDLYADYKNDGNEVCLLAAVGSAISGYKYVLYDETNDKWLSYHNWGAPAAVDVNNDGISEILMQFEGLHNNAADVNILTYDKGQFMVSGINSAVYEKTGLIKGVTNVDSSFVEQDDNILIDIELFGDIRMCRSYSFSEGSLEYLKEFEQPRSIVYENTQFGFNFMLPSSWGNFDVVAEEWEGLSIGDPEGDKVVETGAVISIRHPLWTVQNPRQDIPIMIFTMDQWNSLKEEKFHIGAAPVGPSEIDRSSKYVFVLPARYNFAYLPGTVEVERILEQNPLIPSENTEMLDSDI